MGLLPAKTPYGAGLYVTTTETSAHSVYNARTSFTEATAGSITDGMTTAGYHRDLWVVYETDGVEENEFGPVSP